MRYHQEIPDIGYPNHNVPTLSDRVLGIRKSGRQVIIENRGSFREGNVMLSQIDFRLVRIPSKLHFKSNLRAKVLRGGVINRKRGRGLFGVELFAFIDHGVSL